jgi:hypothetical protein
MRNFARVGSTLLVVLAGCADATGPDAFVRPGTWGGDHASLLVEPASASIEFDCAHGRLSVPITLERGQFDVAGVFVAEHGGPIREDDIVAQQPARYRGSVEGHRMTLRVRLDEGQQDLGTYTLTLGMAGRVLKCLSVNAE